jgi:hypothetical protein
MLEQKLGLLITHNIFLTKEERYALAKGNPLRVVGVSLPVWFLTESGKTTEPGIEVFCEYHILNRKGEASVESYGQGYELNIPQLPDDYVPRKGPSDKTWRKWKFEEKERWYERHPVPPTGENLRDIEDGGSEYLRFEFMREATVGDSEVSVVHVVEMKTIELLEQSILRTIL